MSPDINSLSLEEQVAQMFVVRASGHLFDHQIEFPAWEPPAATLQHWIADLGVGGVIFVGGSAGDLMLRSHILQSQAKFPLLLAADVEEGVGQRFAGATWFAPPMALSTIAQQDLAKAKEFAYLMGSAIAQESLAIGLNWVLAPVVDVNNNPDNPVINVRSFGETPHLVAELTSAFIQGAKQWPVLTCAKHFPGHGDTSVDSHLELPVLPHSAERLAEIELPPFISAIASGVDSVMSAHLLIPCWDADRPATLSPKILTGQLRQNLGFPGLIVTDALVMGAIAKRYGATEAPILALEAGADILLMPVDPAAAIQAICEAVKSGRISRDRLSASVERIWQVKQKVAPKVIGDRCSVQPLTQLATPTTMSLNDDIIASSQQVGGSLPLRPTPKETGQKSRNLIVVDDILRARYLGHHVPAIQIPQQFGYEVQVIDQYISFANLTAEEEQELPKLVQLFIRGNPFRGSANLTAAIANQLQKMLQQGRVQGLVCYGSPYIIQSLLPNLKGKIPYVFSYGQMPGAQAIALKTLFGLYP